MPVSEQAAAPRHTSREPGARRRRARRRTSRRPGRTRAAVLTLVLLVIVLIVGRTSRGADEVERLRRFLEFYVGVFTLLAATAAVVAGVAAAQRVLPIGLRILAQGAHRATAIMAIGFLVTHIALKVMEAHATVLDAFLPFTGHGRAALLVGLGTIAGDLLIVIVATGVLRGRFVTGPRPWLWRTVHALAYVMWALAILHGLTAGRPPKAWVTWSYLICAALVLVAATGRLPRLARDRRMLRARKARGDGRVTGSGARDGAADPRDRVSADARAAAETGDLPDEQFWAALRAETSPWPGGR
ncbi:hypothetical protein NE235_25980 [Actinoallomurus spadix]|uniref:Uncharacterized protein n=1 Tax=Actinoallomurus spadix TaxID=79912 RepID=A0ABN0X2G5_9ACTN|nr:hypothetical protein [Actinoallomurus spadix]MCO5989563.1 hypothetical protein [Actinoallomurus spadix]